MQERPEVESEPAKPQEDAPRVRLPEEPRLAEDDVDEVVAQSFPASDPPQWWAGGRD